VAILRPQGGSGANQNQRQRMRLSGPDQHHQLPACWQCGHLKSVTAVVVPSLAGSSLYFGITNALYLDTVGFGKQKATNNIKSLSIPAFTNLNPSVYMRGPMALPFVSRSGRLLIADAETTVPNFVQANVDFSGGRLDALVGNLTLGRGESTTTDTGFAQGKTDIHGGTLDALIKQWLATQH